MSSFRLRFLFFRGVGKFTSLKGRSPTKNDVEHSVCYRRNPTAKRLSSSRTGPRSVVFGLVKVSWLLAVLAPASSVVEVANCLGNVATFSKTDGQTMMMSFS